MQTVSGILYSSQHRFQRSILLAISTARLDDSPAGGCKILFAADSFQPTEALVLANRIRAPIDLSPDDRLRDAARREGFLFVPERT